MNLSGLGRKKTLWVVTLGEDIQNKSKTGESFVDEYPMNFELSEWINFIYWLEVNDIKGDMEMAESDSYYAIGLMFLYFLLNIIFKY